MSRLKFRDNALIITGASSGIGRELALQLADQGAWLALAARNREKLGQVAESCRARGRRALVVPTDVSEQSQCRNLVERTVAEFGRVDMLVNNAGISMRAAFEDIEDLAPFENIMRVNYFGSM